MISSNGQSVIDRVVNVSKDIDSVNTSIRPTNESIQAKPAISNYTYDIELLDKTYDEFDNTTRFETTETGDIKIYKFIEQAETTYYLSMYAYSEYCTAGCTGIIILFTDGTKWSKPNEKIDMDVSGDNSKGSFEYRGFVTLTKTDRTIFSTKQIKAYKLYIFDQSYPYEYAKQLMKGCTAIINAK